MLLNEVVVTTPTIGSNVEEFHYKVKTERRSEAANASVARCLTEPKVYHVGHWRARKAAVVVGNLLCQHKGKRWWWCLVCVS